MTMDPILVVAFAFLVLILGGIALIVRLTARYLDKHGGATVGETLADLPAAVASARRSGLVVTGSVAGGSGSRVSLAPAPSVPASTPTGAKAALDQSMHALIAHELESRKAIQSHRRLLLIIISAIFGFIALVMLARLFLAIAAQYSDKDDLKKLVVDSKFWLSTIGVGAVVQGMAVTLLYSLHSFSRQMMHSFEPLSRIYRAYVAIGLINEASGDVEAANLVTARLDAIRSITEPLSTDPAPHLPKPKARHE